MVNLLNLFVDVLNVYNVERYSLRMVIGSINSPSLDGCCNTATSLVLKWFGKFGTSSQTQSLVESIRWTKKVATQQLSSRSMQFDFGQVQLQQKFDFQLEWQSPTQ